MNLQELKTKDDLKEGHMTLLFDVLYTYHEFDKLYSFDEFEDLLNAIIYIEKPTNYYLKALLDLIDLELIQFVIDKEAKFFIVSEEIRGIEFFKELEKEVC